MNRLEVVGGDAAGG